MTYTTPPERPFDPGTPDYRPESLALDAVLREALVAHTLGLYVARPGYVVRVAGDQTVDVQPTLRVRYHTEDAPADMPVLKNVPVCMPMGQGYALRLPLSVNDPGLLLFCDRSLDAWSASSGSQPVDPADSRQHALSDAVWLPGLVPTSGQSAESAGHLVASCGSTEVRLTPDGKLALGSSAAELVALVDDLAATVASLASTLATALVQVSSPGTPAPFAPNVVAALSQSQADAQRLKATLDTLKV